MADLFVVLQHDFDYNDEINYQSGNGGYPIKVFYDESLAKLHASDLTYKELRGLNLGDYCYNMDEIDPTSKVRDTLEKLGVECENWDTIIPSDISDEDLKEIYNGLSLQFFSVIKVDDILPASLIKKDVEGRVEVGEA